MDQFQPITQFLLELSREAHVIMLKHFSPLGVAAEWKADNSPVTRADFEINELVIARVAERYPEYDVLAEERSTGNTSNPKLFVVDPVDGTLTFSIGAPTFGFSAAVVEHGVSIAGVLSNPLVKRTLIAEKGKGAYLAETGVRIHVSAKSALSESIINAGWEASHDTELLYKQGARTLQVYSICESSSLVALGGIEGDIFTGQMAHDVAAAKIIVEEAGGKVTDIEGNEQHYGTRVNGAVISNGLVHDQLLKIAQKSGAVERVLAS